jgi:hypothetical protein
MLRSLASLLLILAAQTVQAQNIAVQQPVLQDFSVDTTVTVPDRGTALLGSVRSGAAGRASYGFGPFRNGSSRGYSLSGSSVTTSVYIHDLRAMDEALLATAEPSAPSASRWEAALARRHAADRTAEPARAEPERDLDKRLKFERLAREAEASRKMSLALAYWKAAAKYGSPTAAEKIAAR